MADTQTESFGIILVGAGGFGREVLLYVQDAIQRLPQLHIKGFLDDNPSALQLQHCDLPLLGSIKDYVIQPHDRFVMTIGDTFTRAKRIHEMEARGARFQTIIHPTAYVAPTAVLGNGCIVAPFSSIGNDAKVGDHVVLTWYSSIAHDCMIQAFVVFSPYSTANGAVVLEEGAFLGTHAIINPLVRIGAWSKISSGSVVYRNVPPNCLAMGNPAKSRPMLRSNAPAS